MTSSSVVIVVMSQAMRSSEWVDREIEHALNMEAEQDREVLLPIRIDAAALPDRLTDRVYADFSAAPTRARSRSCAPSWTATSAMTGVRVP